MNPKKGNYYGASKYVGTRTDRFTKHSDLYSYSVKHKLCYDLLTVCRDEIPGKLCRSHDGQSPSFSVWFRV